MKRFQLAALLMTLLIPSTAMAALRFYNTAGSSLGVRSEFKCGTGLTCTVAAGRITAVSSPTLAGPLSITGTGAFSGAVTVGGDLSGDGGDQLVGFLQNQVASTTTGITAAQCGTTFVSNSADVMALPEASTVPGCRLTFICGTADNFDINPDDADLFLPTGALAPSAGDALRCTDLGAGFVIEAISASGWAVLSTNLTITDVD